MENVFILTNNPNVAELSYEKLLVDGDFEAVLIKARDLIQDGYSLISHPLGASSRMLLSPYRSLLMKKQTLSLSEQSLTLIENSIDTYRKMTAKRKPDNDNASDYAMVDKVLLMSTIKENVCFEGIVGGN